MEGKKKKQVSTLPKNLVKPIADFLENELKKVFKSRAETVKNNPALDEGRDVENSLEEDVDEQLDQMGHEMKVGFFKRRITELKVVLARIKNGKYGMCRECGKMIDTDRLAVKPEAILCVKCEKKGE